MKHDKTHGGASKNRAGVVHHSSRLPIRSEPQIAIPVQSDDIPDGDVSLAEHHKKCRSLKARSAPRLDV